STPPGTNPAARTPVQRIRVASALRIPVQCRAPNSSLAPVPYFRMPPLIRLNDVTIRYRGAPLLDCVTCEIESSQRIGLLDRNGSGKTTLMRMMAGQVKPDSGE